MFSTNYAITSTVNYNKMLTLPFAICKSLASQSSLSRLTCRNISFKKNFFRCRSKIDFLNFKKGSNLYIGGHPNLSVNKNVKLAVMLINEYSEPESIRWDELINKLKDSKVTNIRSTILQGCLALRKTRPGLSFYNYLVEKNEKLTLVDFTIFCKLLVSESNDGLIDESLIKTLYDNMKNHLQDSPIIPEFVLPLVAKSPTCFFDFVEKMGEKLCASGRELVLIKALDFDRFDLVLKFLKIYNGGLRKNFIESYLNYLTRMATKNEFLPDFITILTNTCEKKASVLVCSNLLSLFKSFANNLNQLQSSYTWSATACGISIENVCSNCGFQLVNRPISDAEFKELQEHCFLKIGLLNKNVFLSSSQKEFQSFLSFLDTCEPYNVVLDFLNVFHQVKHFKMETLNSVLRKLLSQGHSVLIIARKHIKHTLSRNFFLKYKAKEKVQFFFTDDLSDDDVFVLYAALHGGPGKYIVSKDFYSSYRLDLDEDGKNLFLRWKMYHQFLVEKRELIPPCAHLGVPQLTSTPDENEKKFVWHLSYKPDFSSPIISRNSELKWICFQAVKNLS